MSKPEIGNSFGEAEVRFGVRSRVPWVGDENSGGFRILTVSGLRNFSKISLKKVWRIVKKQYFCGPVSRERGRGGGSRGKETFRKIFAKKFGGSKKKMYFCTPKRKEGATGTAGRPGRGEAEAGAQAPEADAERRVH